MRIDSRFQAKQHQGEGGLLPGINNPGRDHEINVQEGQADGT